jgi:hypothetical protein
MPIFLELRLGIGRHPKKQNKKFSKSKKENRQDTEIPKVIRKPDIWSSRQSFKKKISHETQRASRYKGMIEKYFNPGHKNSKRQKKEKALMSKPVEVNLFSDSREVSESSVSQPRAQVKNGVRSDDNSHDIKIANTIDFRKISSPSDDLLNEKVIDKRNTLTNPKSLKFEENKPPNTTTALKITPIDL